MAITTPRIGAFTAQDGGQAGVDNTMTVPLPTTVNVGELLLIHAWSLSTTDDPQPPDGTWVEWRNATSGRHKLYAKTATATEAQTGGTKTLELPFLDVPTQNVRCARIIAVPGAADISIALDGQPQIAGSTTDMPYNALTVNNDGCVVFILGAIGDDKSATGLPNTGSFTQLYNDITTVAGDSGLLGEYWIQTAKTNIIAGSITLQTGGGGNSFVFAVRAAAAGITPAKGSLSITGRQAGVAQQNPNKSATPATGALSLAGAQPVLVKTSPALQPGTASLSLSGRQPSAAIGFGGIAGLPPPPPGYQYVTVDVSAGTPALSVFFGASPPVATGDVAILPLHTPTGYDITMLSNGLFTIEAGGDGAKQQFTLDVFDVSLGTYYGQTFIYVNNTAPVIIDVVNTTFFLTLNSPFSVDMSGLAADLEGAAITVTKSTSNQPEMAMSGNIFFGTPTTRGIFQESFVFQDETGDSILQQYTLVVGFVTVPDIRGQFPEDVGGPLGQVFLEATLSPTFEYNDFFDVGIIFAQNPSPGTLVPPGTVVTFSVSLGPNYSTQTGIGGGHSGYDGDEHGRRKRLDRGFEKTLRRIYGLLYPAPLGDEEETEPEVSPDVSKEPTPRVANPKYATPRLVSALRQSAPAKQALDLGRFDTARKLNVKKGSRYRGH